MSRISDILADQQRIHLEARIADLEYTVSKLADSLYNDSGCKLFLQEAVRDIKTLRVVSKDAGDPESEKIVLYDTSWPHAHY